MPRTRAVRIPVEDLQTDREVLFDVQKFTGAQIAEELGENPVTLWSWFGRRGLEPAMAHQIAGVIDGWVVELQASAARLRDMAGKLDDEDQPTPEEVEDAA